jgi:hypothetical protein
MGTQYPFKIIMMDENGLNSLIMLSASIKLAISLFNIVRLQRWQVSLALVAITLPWVGNTIYITGIIPEYFLDWTSFVFLFSGVLFSIACSASSWLILFPSPGGSFAGLADYIGLDINDRCETNPSKNLVNCSRRHGENISV